mmetsp:Transcript_11540/g.32111  ORF Transcript_11540/g.32111 Transcript_11540/m.32111 type:complete len:241 (+) Transcript_11540:1065-1787(+)
MILCISAAVLVGDVQRVRNGVSREHNKGNHLHDPDLPLHNANDEEGKAAHHKDRAHHNEDRQENVTREHQHAQKRQAQHNGQRDGGGVDELSCCLNAHPIVRHVESTLSEDLRGCVSVSDVRVPQAHVDQALVHVVVLVEITPETQETGAQDAVTQPEIPVSALPTHSGSVLPLIQECVELIAPNRKGLTSIRKPIPKFRDPAATVNGHQFFVQGGTQEIHVTLRPWLAGLELWKETPLF